MLVAPCERAATARPPASQLEDRSVQPYQAARPGAHVQVVHVLRDDVPAWARLRPPREHPVRSVRVTSEDLFAAPGVPFPDGLRIARERLRRREIRRAEVAPQPARATKGWN